MFGAGQNNDNVATPGFYCINALFLSLGSRVQAVHGCHVKSFLSLFLLSTDKLLCTTKTHLENFVLNLVP